MSCINKTLLSSKHVIKEYIIILKDESLKIFLDETNLRSIGVKTNCYIELTNRILNRKMNTFKFIKYAIVKITGLDECAIRQCNRLLEHQFPLYRNRKDYQRKAECCTIYSQEFVPDNSELVFPCQRTGVTTYQFGDILIKSPHEPTVLRPNDVCQWRSGDTDLKKGITMSNSKQNSSYLNWYFKNSLLDQEPFNPKSKSKYVFDKCVNEDFDFSKSEYNKLYKTKKYGDYPNKRDVFINNLQTNEFTYSEFESPMTSVIMELSKNKARGKNLSKNLEFSHGIIEMEDQLVEVSFERIFNDIQQDYFNHFIDSICDLKALDSNKEIKGKIQNRISEQSLHKTDEICDVNNSVVKDVFSPIEDPTKEETDKEFLAKIQTEFFTKDEMIQSDLSPVKEKEKLKTSLKNLGSKSGSIESQKSKDSFKMKNNDKQTSVTLDDPIKVVCQEKITEVTDNMPERQGSYKIRNPLSIGAEDNQYDKENQRKNDFFVNAKKEDTIPFSTQNIVQNINQENITEITNILPVSLTNEEIEYNPIELNPLKDVNDQLKVCNFSTDSIGNVHTDNENKTTNLMQDNVIQFITEKCIDGIINNVLYLNNSPDELVGLGSCYFLDDLCDWILDGLILEMIDKQSMYFILNDLVSLTKEDQKLSSSISTLLPKDPRKSSSFSENEKPTKPFNEIFAIIDDGALNKVAHDGKELPSEKPEPLEPKRNPSATRIETEAVPTKRSSSKSEKKSLVKFKNSNIEIEKPQSSQEGSSIKNKKMNDSIKKDNGRRNSLNESIKSLESNDESKFKQNCLKTPLVSFTYKESKTSQPNQQIDLKIKKFKPDPKPQKKSSGKKPDKKDQSAKNENDKMNNIINDSKEINTEDCEEFSFTKSSVENSKDDKRQTNTNRITFGRLETMLDTTNDAKEYDVKFLEHTNTSLSIMSSRINTGYTTMNNYLNGERVKSSKISPVDDMPNIQTHTVKQGDRNSKIIKVDTGEERFKSSSVMSTFESSDTSNFQIDSKCDEFPKSQLSQSNILCPTHCCMKCCLFNKEKVTTKGSNQQNITYCQMTSSDVVEIEDSDMYQSIKDTFKSKNSNELDFVISNKQTSENCEKYKPKPSYTEILHSGYISNVDIGIDSVNEDIDMFLSTKLENCTTHNFEHFLPSNQGMEILTYEIVTIISVRCSENMCHILYETSGERNVVIPQNCDKSLIKYSEVVNFGHSKTDSIFSIFGMSKSDNKSRISFDSTISIENELDPTDMLENFVNYDFGTVKPNLSIVDDLCSTYSTDCTMISDSSLAEKEIALPTKIKRIKSNNMFEHNNNSPQCYDSVLEDSVNFTSSQENISFENFETDTQCESFFDKISKVSLKDDDCLLELVNHQIQSIEEKIHPVNYSIDLTNHHQFSSSLPQSQSQPKIKKTLLSLSRDGKLQRFGKDVGKRNQYRYKENFLKKCSNDYFSFFNDPQIEMNKFCDLPISDLESPNSNSDSNSVNKTSISSSKSRTRTRTRTLSEKLKRKALNFISKFRSLKECPSSKITDTDDNVTSVTSNNSNNCYMPSDVFLEKTVDSELSKTSFVSHFNIHKFDSLNRMKFTKNSFKIRTS